MSNDEQKMLLIDETQDLVRQKACILSPKEIISTIGRLTRDLDMEIDEGILLDKFESTSHNKDVIYQKRSQKLEDIMSEIKRHEMVIKGH